ncbi:MAG TPA: adenine phosphoribosyltransferase [Solirubrobacteraceae bacterium]|nr:adenine phosphoribosyltransferase [Solirubrobacteraceae bacterium]
MGDELRHLIREIPDFPSPGIGFKDITPLLADAAALDGAVRGLAELARPMRPDLVIGAEARGFLLGPALARELGCGFVLARKPGRLPHQTVRVEYELEYGADALELHADAVAPGHRVLVHDDLLATGGTAGALCRLVGVAGARVAGCVFLIELAFLGGAGRLAPHPVAALLRYDAG